MVPPPISTITEPTASCTGILIPIAAAIGSSTIYTSLAPADFAASSTALISTLVIPVGTPITTLGLINFLEIFSVIASIFPTSIAWLPSSKSSI